MDGLSLDAGDLPGAEAIYLFKTYSKLNYTFETPSKYPIASRVECHVKAIQSAVEQFLHLPVQPES
jgi:hypothetical protein